MADVFRHRGTRIWAPAFTLTEVLIALAIFALGFVSIASVFPVAVVLQKETTDDMVAQQFARNAQADLKGRKFKAVDLNNPTGPFFIPDSLAVQPILKLRALGPGIISQSPNVFERWMVNDRSYFFTAAATTYTPQLTSEIATGVNPAYSRSFYWVPLIRRTTPAPTAASDWRVFVFILRRNAEDFDRAGLGAGSGWANYDGFDNYTNPGLDPMWRVPGVYGMPVTLAPSDVTRFNFDNDRNDDGRPDEIQTGDQVLDSNGTVHSVVTADATGVNVSGPILSVPETPNTLWYGRPAAAGKKSPTREILVLSDAVE